MPWFSTKLRLIILVEPIGGDTYMDSIHLFFVKDELGWDGGWATAFDRALELGLAHETEYLNEDKQRVRWRVPAQ
jgi:hypothetical protein